MSFMGLLLDLVVKRVRGSRGVAIAPGRAGAMPPQIDASGGAAGRPASLEGVQHLLDRFLERGVGPGEQATGAVCRFFRFGTIAEVRQDAVVEVTAGTEHAQREAMIGPRQRGLTGERFFDGDSLALGDRFELAG